MHLCNFHKLLLDRFQLDFVFCNLVFIHKMARNLCWTRLGTPDLHIGSLANTNELWVEHTFEKMMDWRRGAKSYSPLLADVTRRSRLWKDPDFNVGTHPDAWLAAESLSQSLPIPPQPGTSKCWRGKAESWWLTVTGSLLTKDWELSNQQALIAEFSALEDRSCIYLGKNFF